jgi:N-acyl homoserine lactone hydrolase
MKMIRRWDIVTIGNLSRNRYWGESDDRSVRGAMCTGTLITGEEFGLLVDPPIQDSRKMAAELDRRAGIAPADIDLIFITHAHGDHHAGLVNFPHATWLAARDVAATLNASGKYDKEIQPASARLPDDIEMIHTPAHTFDHHSLRFECEGLSVVIAGDAVMTRDFWKDRRGFHNSVDFSLASQTMDKLAEIADIVVPGHDNYFLVRTPK